MRQHKHFPINRQGRDYFVGDLHGHFSLLMKTLGRVGFDHDRDRLFCTGDLIDRGLQSPECIRLLSEPWFHSVTGNHECLFTVGRKDPRARAMHIKNGGAWAYEIPELEREELFGIIRANFCLGFTVEAGRGRIGVIHAEAPADWESVMCSEIPQSDIKEHLWSVNGYNQALTKRCTPVANVEAVVMGHAGCDYLTADANQVWIDTVIRSGRLTVVDYERVFQEVGYG